MMNNPNTNTSVAPGENSACRTAAATNAKAAFAAAKASTEERTSDPSEFLSGQSRRVGVGLACQSASDVREEKVAAVASAVKRGN
jgi:hypothetical protein